MSAGSQGSCTIVWFRNDLRLDDHPALVYAIKQGLPVVPVYVWYHDEEEKEPANAKQPAIGGASRWWLVESLRSLDASLRKLGSQMIVCSGRASTVLSELAQTLKAQSVCWTQSFEPGLRAQDTEVSAALKRIGVEARTFPMNILFDWSTLKTGSGDPYKVFTPFWRACQSTQTEQVVKPLPAPRKSIKALDQEALASIRKLIVPEEDWIKWQGVQRGWQGELGRHWTPGESTAHTTLKHFLREGIATYEKERDVPANETGTSHLSPYLHFGEISMRRVWHSVTEAITDCDTAYVESMQAFLRETAWREFATYQLFHFPEMVTRNMRREFDRFEWRDPKRLKAAANDLRAWKKGLTGYPIVDAGMRQLRATGYMHNRVRMIVASFLVKDLLLHWSHGAKWFWDNLVDADLANNTMGWQWSAGTGFDAAPYFRIFNPITQGQRYDRLGAYVRKWIPELAGLEEDAPIHEPRTAEGGMLFSRAVHAGAPMYPAAIVDHKTARNEAMTRFKALRIE